MVIQRIQTLMLFIAAALMAAFCCLPFATVAGADGATAVPFHTAGAPVLLTLSIVVAVLFFAAIFMFKDLRRQMRVTILGIVLLCAAIITTGLVIYVSLDGASPILTGGVTLPVLALIAGVLAYRGMRHDHRLLTSADRLR